MERRNAHHFTSGMGVQYFHNTAYRYVSRWYFQAAYYQIYDPLNRSYCGNRIVSNEVFDEWVLTVTLQDTAVPMGRFLLIQFDIQFVN